jgi:hypothetical protein
MFRFPIARCLAAGFLGLALTASPQAKGWPPDSPVLVAKGKDHLIHYLPAPARGLAGGYAGSDVALLHTTPSTGEMKTLLRMRNNRFDLLGYIADGDRLYVAARVEATFGSFGFPPAGVVEYQFHVYTFWLADGTELAHRTMKESDVPEELRKGKPVAEGGPIELTEGGARCFGTSLKFDGKKVIEPPPE